MHMTEEAAASVSTDSREAPGSTGLRVRARWFSLPQAAAVLGISEVALRKRLRDGSVTAIRAGRGWRILLPGELPGQASPAPPARARGEDARVLAETAESLVTLVRDLQRQSLVLAAQIGYLQNQLVEAEANVKQLTEGQATTPANQPEMVERTAYDAVLRELEDLRAQQHAAERVEGQRSLRFRWMPWRR
jgi:hypothetical protein